MGFVKKIEPNDKLQKRIQMCRDAEMSIQRNFAADTVEVLMDSDVVLRAKRETATTWLVEYNDEFWNEVQR